MNTITNLCKCGKVLAIDEQDARRIVKRIQKRKGDTGPLRFYECRWNSWHWTSKIHQQKAA